MNLDNLSFVFSDRHMPQLVFDNKMFQKKTEKRNQEGKNLESELLYFIALQ